MARTLGTLHTRLGYALADPDHTEWSALELTAYVNQGVRAVMRRIAKLWPDYWTETGESSVESTDTAIGTAEYALPADFFQMLLVSLTDGDANTSTLESMTVQRAQDSAAEGYYLLGQEIVLVPAPDAKVTDGLVLYYVAVPHEVAASGSPVPLSDHFEDAILEYATLKAKARQGESTGDFGAFYRVVQSDLDAMVMQTNRWGRKHGLTHLHRRYI